MSARILTKHAGLEHLTQLPFPKMLDFELPDDLNANAPPEARGLARDDVRLMVSYRNNPHISHTQFRALPDFLDAGDVVVINTSGTLNAAIDAIRPGWIADRGTPIDSPTG